MNAAAAVRFGEALALLGVGRTEAAVFGFRQAHALDPDSADIIAALGFGLARLGRNAAAAACYRQALALDPRHPAALCNLGELARGQGDLERARSLLSAAVAADPGLAEAHSNLGLVLRAAGEAGEAARALERAVELRPEFADGWSNLAGALIDLDRVEEAVEAGRRATRLAPQSAAAHWNCGLAFGAAQRMTASIASLRRAVALEPANAMARWNLALALLAAGQWREGWSEWEWRFAAGRSRPLPAGAPLLRSPDAAGSVAVYSEQGLGDTLQFLRYAWALERAGARVDLAVPEPVARLLALGRAPLSRIRVNDGSPPPEGAAFEAGLMSLAGIFGARVSRVIAPAPPLALPDPMRARWRDWAAARPRPLVGFAWRGNPRHPADRQRSLPEAVTGEIARLLGRRMVSLQLDAGCPAEDLANTAALIAELDWVISADTMIAHLAGLLGKPAWILLAAAPDWRWLRGRADSPWYPRARLFRQSRAGDWSPVLGEIAEAIGRAGDPGAL